MELVQFLGCHRRGSDHLQSSTCLPHRRDMGKLRKQAKYLEAVAALPTSDPGLLHYFHRKFMPYHPRPVSEPMSYLSSPTAFGSGTYQGYTRGVPNDFKRFKMRQQAEHLVQSVVNLGQPPFQSPTATLFTARARCPRRKAPRGGEYTYVTTLPTRLWISGVPSSRTRPTRRGWAPYGPLATRVSLAPSSMPYNESSLPDHPAPPLAAVSTS